MSKKILLAIPLVLALALVAFVSTSAQGKVALTDAQMSNVYAGCHVDETGDTACAGEWDNGEECVLGENPPAGKCDRVRFTTCKQSEKYCGVEGSGACWERDRVACEGTYESWTCGMQNEECEADYSATYDCKYRTPGVKSDAHMGE